VSGRFRDTPYMEETGALVVQDYRRSEFSSREALSAQVLPLQVNPLHASASSMISRTASDDHVSNLWQRSPKVFHKQGDY
jgi:hypothetical protein